MPLRLFCEDDQKSKSNKQCHDADQKEKKKHLEPSLLTPSVSIASDKRAHERTRKGSDESQTKMFPDSRAGVIQKEDG